MSATPQQNHHEHSDHWFVSALTGCGYLAAGLVLYEFQGLQRTGMIVAVVATCQLLIVIRRGIGRLFMRILRAVGSLFRWRSKTPIAPPPLPTAAVEPANAVQVTTTKGAALESASEVKPESTHAQGNGHERRLASPAGPGMTTTTKLAGRRNPPAVPMSMPRIDRAATVESTVESTADTASLAEDSAQAATLVECPDCHRQISRRAFSCPGCGAPMTVPPPLPSRRRHINRLVIAGASLLLVGMLMLFWNSIAGAIVAGVGLVMIVWGLMRR
ncbi:MAG: hypothetical protein K8T91_15805 [Planctomycetes bacterium]|nr:hypothetical protein [Planctomycetota bacterium]